jgi:hypothetical protein
MTTLPGKGNQFFLDRSLYPQCLHPVVYDDDDDDDGGGHVAETHSVLKKFKELLNL